MREINVKGTTALRCLEKMLDIGMALYLVLIPYVWIAGGFQLQIGWFRVSARTLLAPAAVLLGLALSRWALYRFRNPDADLRELVSSELPPMLRKVLEAGIAAHLLLLPFAEVPAGGPELAAAASRLTGFFGLVLARLFLARNLDTTFTGKAAALLVSAFVGVRWFGFIHAYAVNLLFSDQWDLYEAFFEPTDTVALFFWQHGPHRQGVGALLTRWLADLSDWNTIVESFAVGVVIFFAAVLAVGLKKRLFGSLDWRDAAIPLMFLTLSQYEVVIGTPNLSYGALPLLMMVLYCLCWTLPNRWHRYALVLVLNFSLVFTGFGIFMAVVTPVLFLLDGVHAVRNHRPRRAFAAGLGCAIAVASLLSFFIDYRWLPAVADFRFPHPSFWLYPLCGFAALSNFLGVKGVHGVSLLAGAAVLASMAWAWFLGAAGLWKSVGSTSEWGPEAGRETVVFALLSFTLLFLANAAVGRIGLGLPAAQASRYVVHLIPGFFGLFLFLHRIGGIKGRRLLLLFVICMAAASLPFHAKDREAVLWLSEGKASWKRHYLATGRIEDADLRSGFRIHPDPERTGMDEKLRHLAAHGRNLFIGR